MINLKVISLGAGVQSTTLALMAAEGEITPMPDAAVFADTGWEPPHVYTNLDLLEVLVPFPVYRVSAGNLRNDLLTLAKGDAVGKRAATPPLYTVSRIGRENAMIGRQCTTAYKIEPIHRQLLKLLGHQRGHRHPRSPRVELWLGISLDEYLRVKPAKEKWVQRRWPLIEKQLSRHDCLQWLDRYGYPRPGKSSCIGCPYRTDAEWRDIRANPVTWADAIHVDRQIRNGIRRAEGPLYLHRTLVPLEEADIESDVNTRQNDMINECEGICEV